MRFEVFMMARVQILGCDIMQSCRWLPKFQRNLLLWSSGSKQQVTLVNEAAGYSKLFAATQKIVQCHNPEDHNLKGLEMCVVLHVTLNHVLGVLYTLT
jgi:hypothetical protein